MKIRTKIPLYTGLTVLITTLAVTLYSIFEFRRQVLKNIESYKVEQNEAIKEQLIDHVDNAYKILERSYLETKDSYRLTSVNIQDFPTELKFAVKDIEQIAFGDAGYIWINEVEPPYTVIMHPTKPEMNGTVQVFLIEDTKQNVYEAFAELIQKNKGEGFLEYDYYKPGTNERIPKLSYIKLFEPYGWVLGTGVYIDYIDKKVQDKTEELKSQINRMVAITLILGIILIALAYITLNYLGRIITNSIITVQNKLFRMSKGYIVEIEKAKQKDEIGEMNMSLNDLINGINTYSEFASAIGKGNLDAEFNPLSENDDLGISLLDMRAGLKSAKTEEENRAKENERRHRANEAFAMFSELMRKGSDNMFELSYSVINKLVEFTNCIQGGIFIVNDDDANDIFLELTASVAYERRRYNKKRINIGDGLIGACAFEKEKIYLTDIPENYAEIRSGLGTSAPKSILLIPLLMEDNLIGVIELASLNFIDTHDTEFVEKVSESIAASLFSAKINIKTATLETEFDALLKEKFKINEIIIDKEKEIRALNKRLLELKENKSILSIK
jgi:putative methionine-R-sulfoxide reductase with GAF domain